MPSARLHPLTLRFSPDHLEAAFRVDYFRRSLLLVRWALGLGLVQYAGFGFLDRWMVPVGTAEVRLIRVAVCLYIALAIAYTFAPSFRRTMQASLASVAVVCGLGIAGMTWLAQASNLYYHYYAGVMLVLIYVHVLLRLRFVVAAAVGSALVAGYLAVVALAGTPGPMLANNAFFLVSINFSGMIASYALEHYARRVFLHARRQSESHAVLLDALDRLRTTQTQLVQQEKLASLGRLTAGVAHEIKNPLNFVTGFSALSIELLDELDAAVEEACRAMPEAACAEVTALVADLRANVARIEEHGRRADGIVQGMLEHARPTSGERQAVDLAEVVTRHALLAHESFRARHPEADLGSRPGQALDFDLDPAVGAVVVAPQEIGRVVVNLVGNALLAVCERAAGGEAGYAPTVTLRTRRGPSTVTVEVADNGPGIPASVREHIFEPFFTTRPAGQGTGLGLSLAADTAAAHGGMLTVESEEGQGATFVLTLPAPTLSSDRGPAPAGTARPVSPRPPVPA